MAEQNVGQKKPVTCTKTLETAMSQIFDMLMNEETKNIVHNLGSQLRTDEPNLENCVLSREIEDEIVDLPGFDIFGNSLHSQTPDFRGQCPHCKCIVELSSFTPHLEFCMGIGKTESDIPQTHEQDREASFASKQNEKLEMCRNVDKTKILPQIRTSVASRVLRGESQ